MTAKRLLDEFKQRAADCSVDVHGLSEDRLKVLWALGILKGADELAYHKAADIASNLRECSGVEISRQRAQTILESEYQQRTVSRKRLGGTSQYKIMRSGEDAISGSRVAARFVDPSNALEEIRALESILSAFKGVLRVCDPYIDNKTLDYLAECKAAAEIRLLTVNVQDSTKVRRDLAAFRTQHSSGLEIKVLAGGALHDRYIVYDDGILILGGSLNGFAKKQMFVISLGKDIAGSVSKAFDINWSRAPAF